MALTIQELLSSDTVSQVVDKINFNFDQLLLNGGGPIGPLGPSGLPGPIGGRGERGTEWYEGTDSPLITPPTATPLANDYYLQGNGDVWVYQPGGPWDQTAVNLTGPTGNTGSSVGLSQFGYAPLPSITNYAATAKNVSYPSLIPQNDTTVTSNNEGVPTFAVGIAGPNDSDYPTIPLTNAYQLSTVMAGQLSSENTSMLIHQKNSATQAIRFMGGGGFANENYVQDQLSLLSNISLLPDDKISISVPKAATAPLSIADTYGIINETVNRGQSFRAGTGFSFTSGTVGANPYTTSGSSDFNIELNSFTPLDGAGEAKFDLKVLGAGAQANLQAGGNISIPLTIPPLDGKILAEAGEIVVQANTKVDLRSNSAVGLSTGSNSFIVSTSAIIANVAATNTIDLQSNDGVITIENVGTLGEINLSTNKNIILSNLANGGTSATEIRVGDDRVNLRAITDGSNINILSEGVDSDIRILGTGEIRLGLYNGVSGTSSPKINIKFPESGAFPAHTEFVGYQSWAILDNAPSITDTEIYQSYYTGGVPSDRVIQQFGKPSYTTPAGVQHQQFNDGETGQVSIGIPSYNGATENPIGIFVNDGLNGTIPPQFNTTASDNRNPASEMFRVDKEVTKISNKLILGGDNNIQEYYYDPFVDWQAGAPAGPIGIDVTKPHVRIQIGSLAAPTAAQYDYWAGFDGGKHEFDVTFRLNFENFPTAYGQFVIVELYWAPSLFLQSDIAGSSPSGPGRILQGGVITLSTHNWAEGTGAGQQVNSQTVGRLRVDPDADIAPTLSGGYTVRHTMQSYQFIFSAQGPTDFYNSGSSGAASKTIQKGWSHFCLSDSTEEQLTFEY